jgi:hypothetical protein
MAPPFLYLKNEMAVLPFKMGSALYTESGRSGSPQASKGKGLLLGL